MRRLARHLRTLASALSLLVSLAAAVLWVRSYSTTDRLPRFVEPGQQQLLSARGRLIHLNMRQPYLKPGQLIDAQALAVGEHKFPLTGTLDKPLREQIIEERGRLSVRVLTVRTQPAALENGYGFDFAAWTPGSGWQLVVPHWAVVALGLVLPAAHFGRRAVRRRRQRRSDEQRAGAGEPPAPADGPGPTP